MITFSIGFILLIVAYFLYGKYLERVIGVDPNRPTPAKTNYDGVDYLPLPKWKTFLIQLLNIAGLGPIFGALLGAMYGPVAFLWITFGGILIGGLHDYVSGMISMKKEGQSLPELVGHYLGNVMKQSMRGITLLLMVLVGAVFLVGPAGDLVESIHLGLDHPDILHLGDPAADRQNYRTYLPHLRCSPLLYGAGNSLCPDLWRLCHPGIECR